MVLAGCECDSICESHRETNALLASYDKDIQVVNFLNQYNGEGPGSEKFSVFAIWGAQHPQKVVSIIANQHISNQTIDGILYAISDMGQSEAYCDIYKNLTPTENTILMQKRILGCLKS